jgi:hypothetical protein
MGKKANYILKATLVASVITGAGNMFPGLFTMITGKKSLIEDIKPVIVKSVIHDTVKVVYVPQPEITASNSTIPAYIRYKMAADAPYEEVEKCNCPEDGQFIKVEYATPEQAETMKVPVQPIRWADKPAQENLWSRINSGSNNGNFIDINYDGLSIRMVNNGDNSQAYTNSPVVINGVVIAQ